MLAALAAARVSTLSYELIQRDNGALLVLMPMSEIVGRLLPQLAAHLLETPSGGRGILLAPIPGVPSAEVVILGAGTVGVNAAYGFSAWGVQTTVLDCDINRLRRAERICRGRITTRLSTVSTIAQVVPFTDVLIGALSRIVPMLEPGAGVVTSRYDVHSVVSEYGVAELYGKTLAQRARALIAIAHPDFRETLTAAARRLCYL